MLLPVTSLPLIAQVSNNNEDEVFKTTTQGRHTYDFVPGEILIKFKDDAPAVVNRSRGEFSSVGINGIDSILQEFEVEDMEPLLPNEQSGRTLSKSRTLDGGEVSDHDLSQLYRIRMKKSNLPNKENISKTSQLAKRLEEQTEVEFAEPNYRAYIMGEETVSNNPNQNPSFPIQWGIKTLKIDQLWSKPIVNSKRPVIAILDTGVDTTHPDLKDNITAGYDFVNETTEVRDYNAHGTHVAGIAAAVDNGMGIIGANPKALIMPVTVMQSDGTGDIATIIRGIDFAAQNGATIINMSLGTYSISKALRQACESAYQKCVIVAAAGNDALGIGDGSAAFPAAYSFVIGVQASTINGDRAPFSNIDYDGPNFSAVRDPYGYEGYNYEMSAPGVNILSTVPNGGYKQLSGTSMAAPLVAGAISTLQMIKEYNTQEELWGDLLHTNDFLAAYNIVDRPAELDVIGLQFNDRKELGTEETNDNELANNDGHIDAGETISLYPVLRTVFGEASNIKLHLEAGEYEDASLVTITENDVDFGHALSPYGKNVSQNPIVFKTKANVADGRRVTLRLTAICDNTPKQMSHEFVIAIDNISKIGGILSKDMTLTANKSYLVNTNLAIPEGITLTIEPGTRLEFAEGTELSSFGRLIANGTPEKPIVFTKHKDASLWRGIITSRSGEHMSKTIYTNKEKSLFTLLPTEQTPEEISEFMLTNQYDEEIPYAIWLSDTEEVPNTKFHLSDYIGKWIDENGELDMTGKEQYLTDPGFLTPSVLKMMSDVKALYDQYEHNMTEDKQRMEVISLQVDPWYYYDNPIDTLSYCIIDAIDGYYGECKPYLRDCVFGTDANADFLGFNLGQLSGERVNILGGIAKYYYNGYLLNLEHCNIVNYVYSGYYETGIKYSQIGLNNYLNNKYVSDYDNTGKEYWLGYYTKEINVDKSNNPSYLGTGLESKVRPHVYEMGNAPYTYGKVDLSNMRVKPFSEAHGIVWKVVVNGKDAQDEYEDLAPLGIGRHKFEVYYNRPMNKAVAPNISFGVREPYTQNAVNENGFWNDDGTIYTAYVTITKKTSSDGINRIHVHGGEDNEYFRCPSEKTRFNINVQAASSMSTGFMAIGADDHVDLSWNPSGVDDIEDAMGFNIYRISEATRYEDVLDEFGNKIWDEDTDDWQKNEIIDRDTIRINPYVIDVKETNYVDNTVEKAKTYYYYYKLQGTNLKEYGMSNIVKVLTGTPNIHGDVNGDGLVNVADIVEVINTINNKPSAGNADVNRDNVTNYKDIESIKNILIP